jgi:hypothetical protein
MGLGQGGPGRLPAPRARDRRRTAERGVVLTVRRCAIGVPEAAHVGLWEVYVTVTGTTDGAIARRGRSCRLRSAEQGVVDHKGRVSSSTQGTQVHEGFPTAPSSPCRPASTRSLTISALTERCGALIAEDHGWTINYNF